MIARMNYKALAPLVLAAVIAFAQPVRFIAQEARKAADILSAARKAIGDKKLDALKTFSLQSALQRNIQTMQINSDVEILLELPDKYLRSEASSGGGMVMVSGGNVSGFNGDHPLQKMTGGGMPGAGGGGMVIRMGGSPVPFSNTGSGENPPAEELASTSKPMAPSGQPEASRLKHGWFLMAPPA